MTQLLELALPSDGAADQPAQGLLRLNNAVTFIAGPNGSGKSRLLKWIARTITNLGNLPSGSRIEFSLDDFTSGDARRIVQQAKGDGPFVGTLKIGPLIEVHPNTPGRQSIVLPTLLEDLSGDRPLERRIMTGEFRQKVGDARLALARRPAVWIGDDLAIPPEHLAPLRHKVLSAVRLRFVDEARRRQANLSQFIINQRQNPTPVEAFALLEIDATLEIEVLARVEALTGVKCRLNKEGNSYQILCSRVGRDGTWDLNDEADGVINLLLLLPYLHSKAFDLLFIDEPEAHLYPGLQQTFRSLVYDAAERTGKRVILATHSEKIVAPPAPDFRKSIHVTIPHVVRPEIIQLHQAISRLGDDAGAVHDWLSQQAFGDNQDSVFAALFASETVIVEGPFDLIFLDRIVRFVGREFRAGSVALIEAGGKGGIARLTRFLKSLGRLVKVVVDEDVFQQPGVLVNIASAMGATLPDLAGGIDQALKERIRAQCREFDIHILSTPGIEHFYHTLHGRPMPENPSGKRAALIAELKSIEQLPLLEVRARYQELIEILETAVRRMPAEWLQAHAEETLRILSSIMMTWRRALASGGGPPNLQQVDWFSKIDLLEDGRMILVHRFLSEPPLVLRSADDVVSVVDAWIANFRAATPR